MGFLVTLLLVVLFFRLFLGISVGLFKLLLGVVVFIGVLTLLPLALGLLIPIILVAVLFSIVGFVLKLIF
jgi:hypothetical protein